MSPSHAFGGQPELCSSCCHAQCCTTCHAQPCTTYHAQCCTTCHARCCSYHAPMLLASQLIVEVSEAVPKHARPWFFKFGAMWAMVCIPGVYARHSTLEKMFTPLACVISVFEHACERVAGLLQQISCYNRTVLVSKCSVQSRLPRVALINHTSRIITT